MDTNTEALMTLFENQKVRDAAYVILMELRQQIPKANRIDAIEELDWVLSQICDGNTEDIRQSIENW